MSSLKKTSKVISVGIFIGVKVFVISSRLSIIIFIAKLVILQLTHKAVNPTRHCTVDHIQGLLD